MRDLDEARLRKLDIGVLLVFRGLMEHRKAVTVAESLSLTQSTISHALGRLREAFDDSLFLRSGAGLEPTSVALAIDPQIRACLRALDEALSGPRQFDPAICTDVLRLSALDHSMATLLPRLAAEMDATAPGLRLSVRSMDRDAAIKAFQDERVDLAVGFFWDIPATLIRERLRQEEYLVVGRRQNPMLRGTLSIDDYCRARHLNVAPNGEFHGIVDAALRNLDRTRHCVLSVPMFFPALTIVSQTDMIATLPATMVRRYAQMFDLTVAHPPVELGCIEISAVRHRRDEKNPLLDWAIDVLRTEPDPTPKA